MADIRVRGVNTTTGQTNEVTDADTLVPLDAGDSLNLAGNAGTTTGAGGNITLTGGAGGSTSGNGGDVTLAGGSVTSGNAGRVVFTSGGTTYGLTAGGGAGPALTTTATTIIEAINEIDGASGASALSVVLGVGNTTGGTDIEVSNTDEVRGVDAATGLTLNLRGGNGSTGGGGTVNIDGGQAFSGTGGSVTINAGTASSSGAGGAITMGTGNGTGVGSAGAFTITTGNAGGGASGPGGTFQVTGGTGFNVGTGGPINLTGGQGGTNGNGGNITLTGGAHGATSGVRGVVTVATGFVTSNILSPATLATGNNNDYNPTNLDEAAIVRLTGDGAGTSVITGIQVQQDGRRIVLTNIGNDNITFNHDDSNTGNVASRLFLPGGVNFALGSGHSVEIYYDGVSNRWRFVLPQ